MKAAYVISRSPVRVFPLLSKRPELPYGSVTFNFASSKRSPETLRNFRAQTASPRTRRLARPWRHLCGLSQGPQAEHVRSRHLFLIVPRRLSNSPHRKSLAARGTNVSNLTRLLKGCFLMSTPLALVSLVGRDGDLRAPLFWYGVLNPSNHQGLAVFGAHCRKNLLHLFQLRLGAIAVLVDLILFQVCGLGEGNLRLKIAGDNGGQRVGKVGHELNDNIIRGKKAIRSCGNQRALIMNRAGSPRTSVFPFHMSPMY